MLGVGAARSAVTCSRAWGRGCGRPAAFGRAASGGGQTCVSAERPLPRTLGRAFSRGRAAGQAEGRELVGPGRAHGKGTASSSSTFLPGRTRPGLASGRRALDGHRQSARGRRALLAPCASRPQPRAHVAERPHSPGRLRPSVPGGRTVAPTLHVAHPVPLVIGARESEAPRQLRVTRPAGPEGRVWAPRNLPVLRAVATGSLRFGKQQDIWGLVPRSPPANSQRVDESQV